MNNELAGNFELLGAIHLEVYFFKDNVGLN